MFVRDVMTQDPVTVGLGATIKDAALVLTSRGITALPVTDDAGRLCGVISEADILKDAFVPDQRTHVIPTQGNGRSPARFVSDVMTPHAMSVRPPTEGAEAAELMTSTAVKSLPVLDDQGHLVGVISRSDLIGMRARADDVIEREVDSLLVSLGH